MIVPGWITTAAEDTVLRAPSQLASMMEMSSRAFEHEGLESALAAFVKLLPEEADVSRLASSTSGGFDDLLVTLTGQGRGKLLLLGSADTQAPLDFVHHPFKQQGNDIYGSGSHQGKGGLVVAAAVLRALAGQTALFERVQLLVTCDHYNRDLPIAHLQSDITKADALIGFSGADGYDDTEGIIVHRQGAWTLTVEAKGYSEFSPVAVRNGKSSIIALAQVAKSLTTLVVEENESLTVVPTQLVADSAIDRVPERAVLACDVHAHSPQTARNVLAMVPNELDGVKLQSSLTKRFPPLDARTSGFPLLSGAASLLDIAVSGIVDARPSDVAWFAQEVPLAVDGLGALGGRAMFTNPQTGSNEPLEFIDASSFYKRTALAIGTAYAALFQSQRREISG